MLRSPLSDPPCTRYRLSGIYRATESTLRALRPPSFPAFALHPNITFSSIFLASRTFRRTVSFSMDAPSKAEDLKEQRWHGARKAVLQSQKWWAIEEKSTDCWKIPQVFGDLLHSAKSTPQEVIRQRTSGGHARDEHEVARLVSELQRWEQKIGREALVNALMLRRLNTLSTEDYLTKLSKLFFSTGAGTQDEGVLTNKSTTTPDGRRSASLSKSLYSTSVNPSNLPNSTGDFIHGDVRERQTFTFGEGSTWW
jgi:hypothetical protein